MNLDSIMDERRTKLPPHMLDEHLDFDTDNDNERRLNLKLRSNNAGINLNNRPRRRAYAYADALAPEFDAGVPHGQYNALPPLMIRNNDTSLPAGTLDGSDYDLEPSIAAPNLLRAKRKPRHV